MNRHIINLIHAKKEMIQLKVINILGLLSIVITLILTLTGFQIFISRMLIQQDNFQYINWLYSINIQISQSYSEQNIKFLQESGLWKLQTPSENQQFEALIDQLLKQRHNLTNYLLTQQSMCTNTEIQVFNIIKNKQITQRIYFNKNYYSNITVSLLYSLDMQMANLFHFVYEQDDIGLFRFTGQNNYPTINSQLEVINDEIDTSYQEQLSEIQNQTQIQLFVVMSVSFFFLMSIIPSYQFLKNKQQQIMELFATFDPKYLKDILYRIYSQIGSAGFSDKSSVMAIKLSQSNFNSEPSRNFEYQINITKKMNISRTSRLNYSIKFLCFALIFLFGCIMVYPISNYFVVFEFIKNSKLVYNFNNITIKLYFNLVNSLRARQAISIGYLLPQYSGLPITFFQQFYDTVLPSFSMQLEQFQEQLSGLKEETIYDENFAKGFLVPLLEENACKTMQMNPNYQGTDFDLNECNSVNKQIMQRGFILGLKSYYIRFRENYDFIYQYDATAYQKAFDEFNQSSTGLQQLRMKNQVTKIFDVMLTFLFDYNNFLYDYYKQLSIIMLCQQLVLIIILYVFGWRLYYRRINEVIFQTKDLLDIFPTSILVQNSYVMSFLKKSE